jgi:hypothetical protein
MNFEGSLNARPTACRCTGRSLPMNSNACLCFLKHPKFRALLKDTPQPLRTYWLATQFGDSAESKLLLIVPAIDLAGSTAMRKRALELVVEAFEASPFGVSEETRFAMEVSLPGQILFRLIYVHALRELGQFERALAELKSLPTNQLTGIVPQPIYGPEEADGDFRWQPVLNDREIWDRSQDERLVLQIAKVEKILLRRDVIPTCIDQNLRVHCRRPMVMMRQG